MTFEEYLAGKKIDPKVFLEKEKDLWESWQREFDQLHPNSFTAQKLYLINPIRRKYPLKDVPPPKQPVAAAVPEKKAGEEEKSATPAKPVVKPARPVFRPKPKP